MSSVDELHQDARPTAESWPSAEELLDGRVPLSHLWPSADDLLDGKAAVPSAGKSGGALFNARSNEFIPPAHFDPNSTSFQPAERLPVVVEQVNPYPMNQGAKELHELNYGRTLTSEEILAARNTPLMLEYDARSRDLDAMYQAARSADRPDLAAQILDEQRRLAEDYGVILIDLNKFGGPLVNLPRIGKQTGLARQAGAAIANTGIGIVESFSDPMVWASMGNGTAAKVFAPLFESQMAREVIDAPKRVLVAIRGGETQEAMEAGLGGTVGASMLIGPKHLHKPKTEYPTARSGPPQFNVAGENALWPSTSENPTSPVKTAEGIKDIRVGASHEAAMAGRREIAKILVPPLERGVELESDQAIGRAPSEGGEKGIRSDSGTGYPRVRLQLETQDGRTVFLDESGPDVSENSVRSRVKAEYPGGAIKSIELWNTAGQLGADNRGAAPSYPGNWKETLVESNSNTEGAEGNSNTPENRETKTSPENPSKREYIFLESRATSNQSRRSPLDAVTIRSAISQIAPNAGVQIDEAEPPISDGRAVAALLEPGGDMLLYRKMLSNNTDVRAAVIQSLAKMLVGDAGYRGYIRWLLKQRPGNEDPLTMDPRQALDPSAWGDLMANLSTREYTQLHALQWNLIKEKLLSIWKAHFGGQPSEQDLHGLLQATLTSKSPAKTTNADKNPTVMHPAPVDQQLENLKPLISQERFHQLDLSRRINELGKRRERRVAELIGGRISNELLYEPGFGRTDIDVIGPNGDLIAVGGPGKLSNLKKLEKVLRLYRNEAGRRKVTAKAYFEEGTPTEVLAVAEVVLGKGNVMEFLK